MKDKHDIKGDVCTILARLSIPFTGWFDITVAHLVMSAISHNKFDIMTPTIIWFIMYLSIQLIRLCIRSRQHKSNVL